MNSNIAKLIELAKENPELPIIAMVDGEIVGGDEYARWLGSFGEVKLGEYTLYDDRFIDDREEFTERYYDLNDDILCEKFKYDPRICEYSVERGRHTQAQYEENNKQEAELNKYLNEVAEKVFKKAIIVYINLPDDTDQSEVSEQ